MILVLAGLALAEDVYVSSDEKGLAILLDGADTGLRTPANLTGVRPGHVTVTVLGECVRGEVSTVVSSGITSRLNVPAVTQLGTLSVQTTPSQAKVLLDDRPWPGTPGAPVALPCGSHTVSAELTGYVPALVSVDLHMDQDLQLPIVMSKLGIGTIELSAQPRAATITLDGKPVGSDAVALPSVFAGAHIIGANLDGYKSARKQIVVADGDSQAWHIELARESSRKDSEVIVLRPGRGAELTEPVAADADDAAADAADAAAEKAAQKAAADKAAAEKAAQKAAADQAARAQREADEERARRKAEDDEAREAADREAADREAAEREAADREAAEQAERDAAREAADRKAAAQAERDAADRKAAAATKTASATKTVSATRTASATKTSKTAEPEHHGLAPAKIAGLTTLGLGLGAGGASGYFMVEANQAYRIYNAKIDAARSQSDAQLSQQAQTYYNRTVLPRRTALYVSGGAAGALLVGGTVLMLVDEHAPGFTPLPGGGMLTFTGHF